MLKIQPTLAETGTPFEAHSALIAFSICRFVNCITPVTLVWRHESAKQRERE